MIIILTWCKFPNLVRSFQEHLSVQNIDRIESIHMTRCVHGVISTWERMLSWQVSLGDLEDSVHSPDASQSTVQSMIFPLSVCLARLHGHTLWWLSLSCCSLVRAVVSCSSSAGPRLSSLSSSSSIALSKRCYGNMGKGSKHDNMQYCNGARAYRSSAVGVASTAPLALPLSRSHGLSPLCLQGCRREFQVPKTSAMASKEVKKIITSLHRFCECALNIYIICVPTGGCTFRIRAARPLQVSILWSFKEAYLPILIFLYLYQDIGGPSLDASTQHSLHSASDCATSRGASTSDRFGGGARDEGINRSLQIGESHQFSQQSEGIKPSLPDMKHTLVRVHLQAEEYFLLIFLLYNYVIMV